jgi:hypothetical protein
MFPLDVEWEDRWVIGLVPWVQALWELERLLPESEYVSKWSSSAANDDGSALDEFNAFNWRPEAHDVQQPQLEGPNSMDKSKVTTEHAPSRQSSQLQIREWQTHIESDWWGEGLIVPCTTVDRATRLTAIVRALGTVRRPQSRATRVRARVGIARGIRRWRRVQGRHVHLGEAVKREAAKMRHEATPPAQTGKEGGNKQHQRVVLSRGKLRRRMEWEEGERRSS